LILTFIDGIILLYFYCILIPTLALEEYTQ